MLEKTITLASEVFRSSSDSPAEHVRQSTMSVPGRKTLFRTRTTEDLKQALIRNNLVYSSYMPVDPSTAPAGTPPFSPFSVSLTLVTPLYATSAPGVMDGLVNRAVSTLVAYLAAQHNSEIVTLSVENLSGPTYTGTVIDSELLAAIRRGEQ